MTIDKRALREEFRFMQEHYSDPADRARQVIYIAAEALLDENIQLQREKDAIEAVALALRDDMRQAREQLAAAERRIAETVQHNAELTARIEPMERRITELEARKVNLSKLSVGEVMHMSGFSRDYAEGWCAGNDNAIHEIRAAGIKVKGE
ncbi:ead/Ea22-like family protein [Salmonella enterica]|uniref:Ead/Ea22-like family protein n=1 Tax=Salmonella enterica TaxID=28901 RepID=A0A3J2D526_SALER|nr:ead/Ea22-like family protein [Salmonella enterica]ECU4769205.1 ead/Ea22-like family protein [Salmonella enterica subsp. enterica]EDQ1017440.1 ead/Ea22-like family protein [Salmonella enterica subsp. houtenae serovar 50:z4,z23:-]EDV3252461.1 ead/Ea22-like family protein [Salmonella enterica subsp. houtenae]EDW0440478.1 ead/Ea22-like family protein [Salmonella enterica subsp. arizonae serovar 50:z4,z23:-]HAE7876140.1 ead/Ea22-like family protein [Salmonella enterica subsp. enterica serovar 1,